MSKVRPVPEGFAVQELLYDMLAMGCAAFEDILAIHSLFSLILRLLRSRRRSLSGSRFSGV
jgi:hypothetical protein